MFGELALNNLEITTTTISFLANYFVYSCLICFTPTTYKLNYSIDYATYHSYTIPEDDWRCIITVSGTQKILFPSIKDIIIREIK